MPHSLTSMNITLRILRLNVAWRTYCVRPQTICSSAPDDPKSHPLSFPSDSAWHQGRQHMSRLSYEDLHDTPQLCLEHPH